MTDSLPTGGPEVVAKTPPQSALYRAMDEARYIRQEQIRNYERHNGRALIVFWGPIHDLRITPFVDAVKDVEPGEPLDLMLTSGGGDGEAAKRMAAMCQANRDDFRVVVPDIAASAATLLTLAAERVIMSDTSRLGPIDPQMYLPGKEGRVAAKDIVELFQDFESKGREDPELGGLYAHLLNDVGAVAYQRSISAIRRTYELVPEILRMRNPAPSESETKALADGLQGLSSHAAFIGHAEAIEMGLPVEYMSPHSEEWDALWRLHARYASLFAGETDSNLIEGRRVSF